MKITEFRDGNRFLSNFWYAPVSYDGMTFPTIEHAFQAAKTSVLEFALAIRDCDTPGDAKKMGRQVPMRKDWDKIKIDVMRHLLRQKFTHPALRTLLIATGDAELIEGNTWDDFFWGVCKGTGQNWLGKLLMEVRAEINHEQFWSDK